MEKYYVRDYEKFNRDGEKLQLVMTYTKKPRRWDYIIRTEKRVEK